MLFCGSRIYIYKHILNPANPHKTTGPPPPPPFPATPPPLLPPPRATLAPRRAPRPLPRGAVGGVPRLKGGAAAAGGGQGTLARSGGGGRAVRFFFFGWGGLVLCVCVFCFFLRGLRVCRDIRSAVHRKPVTTTHTHSHTHNPQNKQARRRHRPGLMGPLPRAGAPPVRFQPIHHRPLPP